MADADDYRIVIIGYDVQSKVAVANALVGYGSYIKQHMCRRIIVKKVSSKHMITGKFTMVVSPGFDTPRWQQVESRFKEYTSKTFVYVHKVGNVHTQGRSPSERIQSSFGKSLSYLVVYHDEVDNTTAQRKAQTLISQFGANYVCINANASRVTKFDITKQLLRAVSNVLKAKDRKLPPAMQTYREKNFFKVVQLKPARKVDAEASPSDIKKYAEDAQRLQTFATWPANVMLNPKLLCDAGFYYTGDSDVCICCRCNLALTDWNEQHDPWVEHCRYEQECKFLSDVLGGTFLKSVKTDLDHVKTTKSSLRLNDARVDIKQEASVSGDTFEGKQSHVDLTKDHWDLYNYTLNNGMVPSNHTRVNIVGHQGVGKTTLLKRLQQVAIKCPDPKQLPTEGIDVDKSITRCLLTDDTRIWHHGGDDLNFEMNYERMAHAMTEQSLSRLTFTGPVKAPDFEEYEEEEEEKAYKESDNLVKETGVFIKFKKDRPSIGLFDDPLDEILMGSEMVDDMYDRPKVGKSMSQKKRDTEKQNKPDEKDYLQTVVDTMAYSQGSSIYLSFWDYAGQIPYYTTHQAFMSPLAVYLLVVDLSKTLDYQITGNMTFRKKGNETTSVLETLRFWNGSIRTYASTIHDTSAPVIVVGTHKDKVNEKRASDVFESIRKEMQCEGVQCIAIDNTLQSTNNKAIVDLKNAIIDAGQDIIEKSIPAKWLQFEYQILKLKSEGKKIISFETFLQLGDDVTEDYMENVLEYMHCKGLVIAHRSLPGMKKLEKPKDIILDPMILVRFLNLIMRRKSLEGSTSKKKVPSIGWCSEGIFDELFVIESTKTDEPELNECTNTLLEVIIHLKIAHPIDTNPRQDNRSFFMPCLLGQKSDDDYVAKSRNCRKTPLIRISFTRKSIPPTLYHSLIASLLSEWHPEKNDEDVSIYNNYGCFKIRGETTLLEIFWKDAYIYLYVVTFDVDLALDELEINALVMKIQQHVNCILLIYRQTNVESEVSICCSQHKDPPSFLTFTELLRGEKVMCCPAGKKQERHAVDVKSALGGWFSRRFMETITTIRGSEMALQSGGQKKQTSLNSKILGRLARYLVEDATTLAKLVRIPQAYVYVESAINDSQGNSALARFFILEIWGQIHGGNATIEKLVAFITQTGFYHAEEILTQAKTDVIPFGKYKNLPASMLGSQPTDKQCDIIASHISERDVLLFIELGIDCVKIKNALTNEENPIIALLLLWKLQGDGATLKTLIDTAAMLGEINVFKIVDSLSGSE